MDRNSELYEETLSQQNQASGDGGSFDCNIFLELAQDPMVTLCGHLFCWPCLYQWLQIHSISKECPVCKAGVVEEKVIPLYGRGKLGSADPRTKPVPGVNIPHRPSGQRPDTTRTTDHHYPSQGFNFMVGQGLVPIRSFGNVTFSAGFRLFPSLFGLQMNGLADTPYGVPSIASNGFHGGPQQVRHDHNQQEAFLSRFLLFLVCLVVFCVIFF